MPFVTVGVFHDQKRKFVPTEVNTANVNAIEIEVILQGGPVDPDDWHGQWQPFATQKVTLAGTHLYVDAADTAQLKT